MKRRIISALLSLILILGAVTPTTEVFAAECEGYSYVIENNEAVITGCNITTDVLTIPDTLDGYPVTIIGEWAFLEKGYTSVFVPASVKEIRKNGLYGAATEAVYLLSEKLTVGVHAFINVPAVYTYDVDSVGAEYSMEATYNLADYPCAPWLLEPVTEGLFTYAVYEGEAILLHIADDLMVTVPDTLGGCPVTRIAPNCCPNTAITQLTLPKTIKYISTCAFYCNYGLRIPALPSGLEYIGDYAFWKNNTLGITRLPAKVRYVGKQAFVHCNLKDFTLNEGLEYLGERALYGNGLTRLTIPSTVTYIGMDVTGAETVTVKNPETFCKYAFEKPTRIIGYAGSTAEKEAYRRGIEFKDIETGEVVTTAYTTIVDKIGYRVTRDGATVISQGTTTSAEHIVLPETVDGKPLIAIGTNAFWEKPLKTIVIPNTVKQIYKYAFHDCRNLYAVVMSENLEFISEESFSSCRSLFMLYLPESCTYYYSSFIGNDQGIVAVCIWPFSYVVKKGSAAERMAKKTSSNRILYAREGYAYFSDRETIYETDGKEATILAIYGESGGSGVYEGADTIWSIPITKVADNAELHGGSPWFKKMIFGYYVREIGEGVISSTQTQELYLGPMVEKLPVPLFSSDFTSYRLFGYDDTYVAEYARAHEIKFYPYGTVPFDDVPKDAWYHDAVTDCYWMEVMNGTSLNSFEPFDHTTRAMIAQVMYNMSGSPSAYYGCPFEDVPDGAWYCKAVSWCEKMGLANGVTSTLFAPEQNVTREQVATFLFRYAYACGLDVSQRQSLDRFADRRQVSGYALEAVQWMVAVGILRGNSDNTLNPGGYATRAEIAAMLSRFCEYALSE